MTFTPMWHPSTSQKLISLFCFFWPFVVFGFLRKRERSPAPILAMLLPIALAMFGTWLGLMSVLGAMPIAGVIRRAAASAGIADALAIAYMAAFSVALIATVTLIRRHRPFLDRMTAVLAIACLVEILAALLFSARIAPVSWQLVLAVAWAVTALVVAVIIPVRLIFVVRRLVLARAIPFGVAITALAFVSAAVLVYSEVHRYQFIAMYG